MVTTYRKRKIFNGLWPCVTVTLSEPFYPDSSLPQREAARALRNEIYNFMCGIAESDDNYAYYEYRKEDAGSAQT